LGLLTPGCTLSLGGQSNLKFCAAHRLFFKARQNQASYDYFAKAVTNAQVPPKPVITLPDE
jgi:hypothetical protein